MLKILTLFLGLYTGAQTVDLEVADSLAGALAEIEVRLDGERVGTLSEPPWRFRMDFGPELTPHELVAVARDAGGRELARDRRWLNLEIEARDEDEAAVTAVVVRLDPEVPSPRPEEMRGWFSVDGEPLEVLEVGTGVAEVVIVRDPAVQSHLDRTARFFFLLELEWNQDWDPATLSDKQAFVAYSEAALQVAQRAGPVWDRWNAAFSFGDDARVRFISPRAAPVSRVAGPHRIFNVATERPSVGDGLLWHSAVVRHLEFRPRLSDAVAMAGLEVHAGRRRRAIVLMVDGEATASNRHSPRAARDYLERLQVPLFVWRFGVIPADPAADPEAPATETPATGPVPPDDGPWGPPRDLTHDQTLNLEGMREWLARVTSAVADVRGELDRQRVVWLAGVHAPHRVELSARAAGVRLAGPVAAPPPPPGDAPATNAQGDE